MKKIFQIIIISIFVLYSYSYSTIRYVSKSGSNIFPYTNQTTASTNVYNAISAASPYDTIKFLDNNTYEEYIDIDKTGLILEGNPNNRPTLQNYPSQGMSFINVYSNHILFKNIIFQNNGGAGSYCIQPYFVSNTISFSNSVFSGNNTSSGLYINNSYELNIKNCEFKNLSKGLIGYHDIENCLIENSYFHDMTMGIAISNFASTIINIRDSKFYYIQTQALYFSQMNNSSIKIYKNYFFDNFNSLKVINSSAYFSFFNNTLYQINDHALYIQTSLSSNMSFDLVNNIFQNFYSNPAHFENSSNTLTVNFENNCYPHGWDLEWDSGVNINDHNNIDSDDAQFTDLDNNDFTIKPSSPCVDKGKNMNLSFNGSAPDIGAFETKSLLDKFTSFSAEQIFSKNNIEMDNRNLKPGDTAHILIKNTFYFYHNYYEDEQFYSLRVDVFSLAGTKIATLYNKIISNDIIQMNLTMSDFDVPSGLYFLRVRSSKFDITKKFTYVR